MSNAEQKTVSIGLVVRPVPPVREHFDEQELERLAQSIRENGVLVPLLVVPRGDKYEVVDGDRRLNAAWAADLREVPVLVRNLTDDQVHIQRMLANLDRHDPDPVSEAKYCAKLIADETFTYEALAEKLGRSTDWIVGRITIAEMPDYMQESLSQSKISLGVCMALHQIKDEGTKERYFKEALRNGMTVRAAEYATLTVNEAIDALADQGEEVTAETVPVEHVVPKVQCALTDEILPVNESRIIRVGIRTFESVKAALREERGSSRT